MMGVISPESTAGNVIDKLPSRSRLEELGIYAAISGCAGSTHVTVTEEKLEATFGASATSMREMNNLVRRHDDPTFPYGARFINPESEITYWGDNI